VTTDERFDRLEEAIKALATVALAGPYMEAEKRAGAETVVRIVSEFDTRNANAKRPPRRGVEGRP
jgi:hypothetical protein